MIHNATLPFLVLFLNATLALSQPSSVTVGNTTLDVRVVIEGTNEQNGIDIPWEIQWGPDNHIWMTERYGRVSRLNPTTGERTTLLDISSTVYASAESGLLGLQLHPDFDNHPEVFLAYTYSSNGIKERIVKYTFNSTTQTLENPQTLLDGINGNTTHIGCRLLILPDTTMLATTGDYQSPSSAQDDNSLSGKVLRMNLDGSIPTDNPFGPTSYVYSKGHRNAQGLVRAPNGNIYSSEHGPSTDDELNLILPGANYGWPSVHGFCSSPSEITACNAMTDYQDPLVNWYDNSTIAPSDVAFYNHPAIPEWQGKILMVVLKAEHLKAITVDEVSGTTVISQEIYFNDAHASNPTSSFNNGLFERLRDVCVAPDGRVFLATNGSSWGTSGTFENTIIELKNAAYSPTSVPTNMSSKAVSHLYPNPSLCTMHLQVSPQLVGASFTVRDNLGKIVHAGSILSSHSELELEHLTSGVYTLQLVGYSSALNQRLIIAK